MSSPSPNAFAYDKHLLEPVNVASSRSLDAPDPFVNKARFALAWTESKGAGFVTWVSINAPNLFPPSASPREGALSCECVASDGSKRFGIAQKEPWVWSADWHLDPSSIDYYRNFLPDFFQGHGICARRSVEGFMMQWDPAWLQPSGNAYRFRDDVIRAFRDVFDIDEDLQEALLASSSMFPCDRPTVPRDTRPAEELRAWWNGAAIAHQKRAGVYGMLLYDELAWQDLADRRPGLHATLRETYYAAGLRGVWIKDTRVYSHVIKSLIKVGVPVYFAWDAELAKHPACVELQPPEWMLKRVWGPMTPPPQSRPLPYQETTTIQWHLSGNGRGERVPPPPCGLCKERDHEQVTCPKLRNEGEGNNNPTTRPVSWNDTEYFDQVPLEVLRSPRHDRNSAQVSLPNEAEAVAHSNWVEVPFEGESLRGVDLPDKFKGSGIPVVAPFEHPPSDSIGVSLLDRLQNVKPKPAPIREPKVNRNTPRVWIFDKGAVMRVVRREANGRVETGKDLVDIALAHGLRFATPTPVLNPQPEVLAPQHAVPNELRLKYQDGDNGKMWNDWMVAMRTLVLRPHFLPAALKRGGVVARIAKDFRPDGFVFEFGPTRAVVDWGVPVERRLSLGFDSPYHDDYLSEEEINIVVGQTIKPGGNDKDAELFLWPREEFVQGWQGVWTPTYEGWYVEKRDNGAASQVEPVSFRKWVAEMRAVADRSNNLPDL